VTNSARCAHCGLGGTPGHDKVEKYASDRFVKNPGEVGLAIEIKKLDNGMLRCADHLRHETR
jgi:hypothetical protein